jgi:hypothetical protein
VSIRLASSDNLRWYSGDKAAIAWITTVESLVRDVSMEGRWCTLCFATYILMEWGEPVRAGLGTEGSTLREAFSGFEMPRWTIEVEQRTSGWGQLTSRSSLNTELLSLGAQVDLVPRHEARWSGALKLSTSTWLNLSWSTMVRYQQTPGCSVSKMCIALVIGSASWISAVV